MLAAIYFRTGNLWVTVFLHSAMDIAAMLIGARQHGWSRSQTRRP